MRRNFLLIACLVVLVALFTAGCGGDDTATTASTAASDAGATTTVAPATGDTTATTAGSTETSAAVEPAADAQVINIRFASEKAPNHIDHTDNFPGFFKMVEAAAGGKYKIEVEYFPVNTILAPPDVYDGIVNGIVDAGQSSMAYTPKRFPVILTVSQPGIAPPQSTAAASKAANELYAKYKPKELADTHLLYLYASGPGWVHSKEKIETVDQLKGKRFRVSGVGVRGVELVGGDPIAMPMADVYEAAQKGTIDALISPAEALEGWKHAELFDYSIFTPYLYASDIFFVTMNQKFWDGLPDDLKAAFEKVSMDAGIRGGEIWDYAHAHGIEYAKQKEKGHQTAEWSEAEKAKLLEALKPVRAEYVKFLDGLGLPGEEIVTTAASLVEEANKAQFKTWAPGQ